MDFLFIYFLLQEAFIHPPEPCEARFIMDGCALFDLIWTVEQKLCHYKAWKSPKIFLYNSDWICLEDKSHIYLACLEGV